MPKNESDQKATLPKRAAPAGLSVQQFRQEVAEEIGIALPRGDSLPARRQQQGTAADPPGSHQS